MTLPLHLPPFPPNSAIWITVKTYNRSPFISHLSMSPFLSNRSFSTSSFVLSLNPQIAAEFWHHTHTSCSPASYSHVWCSKISWDYRGKAFSLLVYLRWCGELRGHSTPTKLLYAPLKHPAQTLLPLSVTWLLNLNIILKQKCSSFLEHKWIDQTERGK